MENCGESNNNQNEVEKSVVEDEAESIEVPEKNEKAEESMAEIEPYAAFSIAETNNTQNELDKSAVEDEAALMEVPDNNEEAAAYTMAEIEPSTNGTDTAIQPSSQENMEDPEMLEEDGLLSSGEVAKDIAYSTPDGKRCKLSRDSGPTPPPIVGMVFDNWESVEVYFRSYAKQSGFGIVKASSSYRMKNGRSTKERRSVSWVCERYGNKDTRRRVEGKKVQLHSIGSQGAKLVTRASKKCQCPVVVYASAHVDGEWVIRRVVLDHFGHSPTPDMSRYVSMFRHDDITRHVRKQLFIQYDVGVKLPQIHRALASQRNGLENTIFTQRDLRNVVAARKKLRMESEGGDANAMVNYFKKMFADNKNFFHAERVDASTRLKDVMWVDARSRAAYEEFGDVVVFDTTYITNTYQLPFANFVGVNHHGQSILFGCALLSHEDSETFEWLFNTWLSCMGGKAPAGILTDQCAAMRKALRLVMPETRHRWCLWHILQKFKTKLGAYEQYRDIKSDLHNAIYDSLTPEEFVDSWEAVIKKYKLEDNNWLEGLFEERGMWIPAEMKHMFWAGMNTTQRSESINSFFDGYVKRHTRLYEFASQYFAAVEARAYAEDQADADCSRNLLEPVTQFAIEHEFLKLYTTAKYFEFQVECLKLVYVTPLERRKISDHLVQHVIEDRVYHRNKKLRKDIPTDKTCEYRVTFDPVTNEAWCSCKILENAGIMCRHLIKVFDVHKVRKLPGTFFITDRWRKDIERKHTRVKVKYHDLTKTEEVKRYDYIMVQIESACLMAAENDKDMDSFIDLVHDFETKLQEACRTASLSKAGDNIHTTPPSSVGNTERALGTPASIAQPITRLGGASTPGACASVGVIGVPCTPGQPIGATTQPEGGDHATEVPFVIKDPPIPKKPRGRPPETRLKSTAEQKSTSKATGKCKGGTRNKKKGQEEACGAWDQMTLEQREEAYKLYVLQQQQQQVQWQNMEFHQNQHYPENADQVRAEFNPQLDSSNSSLPPRFGYFTGMLASLNPDCLNPMSDPIV